MDPKLSVLTDEFFDEDLGKILEYVATEEEIDHIAFRKIGNAQIHEVPDEQLLHVKDMLDSLGLKVSSISGSLFKIPWWGPPDDEDELPDGTPVRDYYMNLVDRSLDIAHMFGTRLVRTFGFQDAGMFPEDQVEIWNDWIGTMRDTIQRARAKGITIIIENVRNSIFSTSASIKEAFKTLTSPNIKVLFDPSNLIASGIGERFSVDLFDVIKDRTGSVHVRDVTIVQPEPYTTKWVMLGEGLVGWSEIVSAFTNHGYSGFWTVEPHLGKEDAWNNAKKSIQKAREMLAI